MRLAMIWTTTWILASGLLIPFGNSNPVIAEEGWGDVEGQFVLNGEVPKPELVFKKNDPAVKDGEVCAAFDYYSEDLVIDPESKGIANIFIYMRAAKNVHPSLASSKEKEVVLDQKNCVFLPHAMVVRTDQSLRVLSDDPVAHNTHTHTFRNQPVNILIKPKDREGILIKTTAPEILPLPITCDIHRHMKANWLITDHPYAAVTDKNGRFKIEKLPAGEHEFRVWHDFGYLNRSFKVTVESNGTTKLDSIEIPLAQLEELKNK